MSCMLLMHLGYGVAIGVFLAFINVQVLFGVWCCDRGVSGIGKRAGIGVFLAFINVQVIWWCFFCFWGIGVSGICKRAGTASLTVSVQGFYFDFSLARTWP